jgi:hypothetical protein
VTLVGSGFTRVFALAAVVLSAPLAAQVQTEVPPWWPAPNRSPWSASKSMEPRSREISKVTPWIATCSSSFHRVTRRKSVVDIPVVYALQGFFIGAEQWSHEIHVPQTIEGAFALGAREMIVVLPDSKTLHNGSMYSSSVTTGDFENFIARDVVSYVDAHYRTLASARSRGLAGHSMGGYGATRIGMKHADVFGSLYIMSPCCLSARQAGPGNPEIDKALEAARTPEDLAKLPFMVRAQLASAAAWSPNPGNPPFYLDLPTRDGAPNLSAGEVGSERAAFLHRSVHRQPAPLPRYRAGRRRSGFSARRHGEAA